ncbi:filamentous hemagglutinin family outer membrane protein [Nostoc carneum NIES-2107]|nr:filamentous hemagglutinin family outer membrane protein [Nostoc carneum NIES-2107]
MKVVLFLLKFTSELFALGSILSVILLWSRCAIAQVISDGTTDTIVKQSENNFNILNGSEKGNNLFHSFSNFSIPQNGSATFDLIHTPNIKTIFSRVTGGKISDINGLIQTLNGNHPVSLLLMNPAGIVFGQNASLNIGGSFVGTTANSIKFADGVEFSAVNPAAPPLLTITLPIGLQLGPNSRGITVQGNGHRLISGLYIPTDRSQNPIGLQVKAGNTLALIGSDVKFVGGIATVNGGGHIEIGSVSDGQVALNSTGQNWVGDYSKVQQFKDINLDERSLLDASGTSGSIQIQGRNINLTAGSAVLMQNLGAQLSKGITINATESLNLTGNSPDGSIGSSIQIDNLGTGQAGDITISARQLSIQDGGIIKTGLFTQGSGGNITANVAKSIDISGFAPSNPTQLSALITGTGNFSNAGNITVSTTNLRLLNGAAFFSTTLAAGQAGTLRVNAKDLIEIAGNNSITLLPSVMSSTTLSSGNANNTFVNTSRLVIRDGGALGSSSLAIGSSGSVIINASESVDINGKGIGSITPSRITSTAEIVDQVTQAVYGLPPIPSGNAGSLTINTPSLRITNGAFVTVKNDGPGSAGDLQINANSIFLDNQGTITASTISGNGGNVKLNVQDDLLMRHDSLITATAAGKGNGGNLSINASVIVGLENSDIIANAVQGQGGKVQITTQGIFGLEFSSQLTAKSDITASSQFGLNGAVEIKTLAVDPSKGIVALPVQPKDASSLITQGCGQNQPSESNHFIVTGRGGLPENPDVVLGSDTVLEDMQTVPILTNSDRSLVTASSINLPSQTANEIVEAQGLLITPQGEILLTAQATVITPHSSGINAASCSTN